MKGIVKYIIAISLLIFVIFVYIEYFSDFNKIEYQIFKHETGHVLNKLIKKTPRRYKDSYKLESIEKNEKYQIIYIRDSLSSDGHYFFYIDFVHQQTSGMLSAPPYYRFRSNNEVTESNYMSHLIDIDLFNEYCNSNGFQTINIMIDQYFRFLHPIGYPEIVVQIKDRNELIDIVNNFPPNPINPKIEILDINAIDLSDQSPKVGYYWFFNAGLYKYYFTINNHNKLEVSAEYIGLLGNEGIVMQCPARPDL